MIRTGSHQESANVEEVAKIKEDYFKFDADIDDVVGKVNLAGMILNF